MQAWKPLARALRFMDPRNARTWRAVEKPAQKFTTAEAERVPPAPWVKINVGGWGDVVLWAAY